MSIFEEFFKGFTKSMSTSSGGLHGVTVSKTNLPDVDSSDQGGNFDTTYDAFFIDASGKYGVPFALMKAHAIRESNLNPAAQHVDNSKEFSAGLMQVEFYKGQNRYAKYGFSDDQLSDGSPLYDVQTNLSIAAQIIKDNLGSSSYPTLRDVINAYNTGVSESKRPAPNNYVNDVISNYETLIGSSIP